MACDVAEHASQARGYQLGVVLPIGLTYFGALYGIMNHPARAGILLPFSIALMPAWLD